LASEIPIEVEVFSLGEDVDEDRVLQAQPRRRGRDVQPLRDHVTGAYALLVDHGIPSPRS
jgi:hypothetical protein